MKLPDKIWITEETIHCDNGHDTYLSVNDPADLSPGAVPYVPASEAERLRERVKELEGAMREAIRNADLEDDDCDCHPVNLARILREALGGGGGVSELR